MAPIIVERTTMASPRAFSRSSVSLASVAKNFSRTAVAAVFVSFLPSVAASGGWDAALLVFVGMHLVAAACLVWLDPNAKLSPPN